MAGLVVVTPSDLAGRRLVALLEEAAGGAGSLAPLTVVSPADLPERLYHAERPATPLQSRLAWLRALRSAEGDTLSKFTLGPSGSDAAAWLALARDTEALHASLAEAGVRFADVPARCEAMGDFDGARWAALGAIYERYEATLGRAALVDRHTARARAVERRACATDRPVVLLGVAELPWIARAMLAQAGERAGAAPIVVLIHAPPEEEDAFDALGCVVADRWVHRRVSLDAGRVSVVDRPRDQAYEAVRWLGQSNPDGGSLATAYGLDRVVVAVGDEAMAPAVARALELAGLPVASRAQRPVTHSRPARLLAALARYLRTRRPADFASLLRHPDVEAFALPPSGATGDSASLLTSLDHYLADHVPSVLGDDWRGEAASADGVKRAHAAVQALAPPDHATPRPLGAWSAAVAGVLQRVYGGARLDPADTDERELLGSLRCLGDALREQASDAGDAALAPAMPLADAIDLTLDRLDGLRPPALPDGLGVRLLAWPDVHLDDAPALVLTGVNEGCLPESVNGDAYLPDHVRRACGLMDNAGRYARDLYLLTATLHSREEVCLVSGRRSAKDDPLTPSRLLLACPPEELAQRVKRFYGRDEEDLPRLRPEDFLVPGVSPDEGRDASRDHAAPGGGAPSRFLIPPPGGVTESLSRLRVTAFRDYLACPYRFYLRHVLRLDALNDRAGEMNSLSFGALAHDVLASFDGGDLAACDDHETIAAFLSQRLDALVARRFGGKPPAAVALQRELLRERLRRWASWQAWRCKAGWRVVKQPEGELGARLDVDGEPFTITGRIDRVEVNVKTGVHTASDFRIGDAVLTPAETHLKRGEWVDLHLPLYRTLARALAIEGPVELGYVQLPKDPARVGLEHAPWGEDELLAAHDKAAEVIRGVRRGEFWPPRYPVEGAWAEPFAGVCMDECLDRAAALGEGR